MAPAPLSFKTRGAGGGGGAQLVRCGPATVAPAAPAPRPSLLSQFITCSSGQWPCLCSKQFHIPASLAGVRAVDLRGRGGGAGGGRIQGPGPATPPPPVSALMFALMLERIDQCSGSGNAEVSGGGGNNSQRQQQHHERDRSTGASAHTNTTPTSDAHTRNYPPPRADCVAVCVMGDRFVPTKLFVHHLKQVPDHPRSVSRTDCSRYQTKKVGNRLSGGLPFDIVRYCSRCRCPCFRTPPPPPPKSTKTNESHAHDHRQTADAPPKGV